MQEGEEREDDGGRVTAGRGDKAGIGDGCAVDFGETEDRFGEEFGGWVGFAVEFLVDFGVVDAEVGAEVDDAEAFVEKGGGVGCGFAVREGEEGDFGTAGGDLIHVGVDKIEVRTGKAGEAGEDSADGSANVAARGDRDEVDLGVREEEADQVAPCVSAGSENGCFDALHRVEDGDSGRPGAWESLFLDEWTWETLKPRTSLRAPLAMAVKMDTKGHEFGGAKECRVGSGVFGVGGPK